MQPEQARTLDVAVSQDLFDDRVSATVGAFEQRFSQLIQYVNGTNSGPPDYVEITPAYYDNLTEARSRGYQGEIDARIVAGLTRAGRTRRLSRASTRCRHRLRAL